MEQLDLNQVWPAQVAVSAGSDSGDLTNVNARGIKVVLDITTISSATVTVTISGKDQASGKYYTLLASAGKTGTGTTVLTVYPGLTAATNVTASDVVPGTYKVSWTVTGGTATFTVGGCFIV
jgi:hypothetical protein